MKCTPEITVQLIHIHGGLKGEIQDFTNPVITIGRLPSYTLHFPADEPGVSREHARIERDGNQFKLIALKDKYGTFVNGRQVREVLLKNGDVIEFGSAGPKVSFNTEFCEPTREPTREASTPYSHLGPPPAGGNEPLRNVLGPEAPRFSHPASGYAEMPCEEAPQLQGERDSDWPQEHQPQDQPLPDQQVQRTSAPLTIQFGPTIRTYRELPVVIGSHERCDFVLQKRDIQDQQALIYFQQGGYYLQDLTGQRTLRVNGKPLEAPVRLNPGDELECGPNGPVFRFLGEGRLAEMEAAKLTAAETPQNNHELSGGSPGEDPPARFLSKLIKAFK
jgi:pSer/pThr/pTyr-binding forkhead associated (FHA) protein